MNSKHSFRNMMIRGVRDLLAIICIGALLPGSPELAAAQTQLPDAPSAQAAAKIPSEQLDSLVAPIALYPDPLLSQTLVASTYPLEVVQLQQWLAQHKDLKEKALADAVKKQDWDPSIQSLAALPEVVKLLAENIKWTTDLGNAFLAQQNDVMDAVQRMRKKAKDAGNLKSSEQVKVETKTVESTAGNRGGAGQSSGCLCAKLQPNRRVRSAHLRLPPNRLSSAGILRGRHGDLVWCGHRDGSDVGRGMGLRLRMGRQQQRLHQSQQQLRQQQQPAEHQQRQPRIATSLIAAATATGSTTRSIVGERRMATETPRTSSAVLPVATPCRIVRRVPVKTGGTATTRGSGATCRIAGIAVQRGHPRHVEPRRRRGRRRPRRQSARSRIVQAPRTAAPSAARAAA